VPRPADAAQNHSTRWDASIVNRTSEAPLPQREPRSRDSGSTEKHVKTVLYDAAHVSCCRTAAAYGEEPTGTWVVASAKRKGARDGIKGP
jgi:hypothetical protein